MLTVFDDILDEFQIIPFFNCLTKKTAIDIKSRELSGHPNGRSQPIQLLLMTMWRSRSC